MAKRIIFTIVLIIICSGSIFYGLYSSRLPGDKVSQNQEVKPPAKSNEADVVPKERLKGPVTSFLFPDLETERGAQKALSEKSSEVLLAWNTAKIISGVIKVLQSAQIRSNLFAESSVNPVSFLTPLDNILDRVSKLLFRAYGVVSFEKLLLAVFGYIVFLVVIPICAIITIITFWTSKERSKIKRVIIVSVLVSLIVPFAIPVSIQASMFMEKKILSNNVTSLQTSIQEKNKIAVGMERDVSGFSRAGRSITTYMTNVKNLANAFSQDIINYLMIFLLINIIVPIFTLLGLFLLARYFARLILRT